MKLRLSVLTAGALGVGLLIGLMLRAQPTAQRDAAGDRAPRAADGKPNLNGVWQVMNTANWDIQDHPAQPGPYPHLLGASFYVPPGKGVVEGNEIPYLPSALEKKKENFAKRMVMDTEDLRVGDPEAKCYLPGVPRATYMPYPFQIIQGTDKILIAYEFAHADRVIHLDKVDPRPYLAVDTWMGHSEGRWEGDTLVVDVRGMNDQTWLDRAGNFHSEALHVVERYTPMGRDALMYEATIEDPKVFTRPWTMSMPIYRRLEKDAKIHEVQCVEFAEPFMYGTVSLPPLK
jgi:hypothetical protein